MTAAAFFKVLFVALSLGLDVFAVSVGVGMKGTDRAVKIRIGAAFAVAEVTMTLLGVLLGQAAGRLLGDVAGYLGFAALVGVGAYMIYEALHGTEEGGGFDLSRGWGLVLGRALDQPRLARDRVLDPLHRRAAGDQPGLHRRSRRCSTTLGLLLGKRLGDRSPRRRAALSAGIVLVLTGLAFAALKYFHVGA